MAPGRPAPGWRAALRPVTQALRSVLGTNGLSTRLAAIEAQLLAAGTSPAEVVAGSRPLMDVNELLHASRSALLRGMPPGAGRLLSAGCAGAWYFEWVERTYGHVPEHIGIEYYMPRPDGLPGNVTWIADTASDMSSVAAATCDLVLSGQNIEHLWPEEVGGFVLEASRVLRPGGTLVVDSPNRNLTAPLAWSHPEHTIELTPDEAATLFRMGGFDVDRVFGIWLCRDAHTQRILPFDPNAACPDWSTTERLLLARDRPADAFIWWIEATRAAREPDAAGVQAYMQELFRRHWPERVGRMVVGPGCQSALEGQDEWIVSMAGHAGAVLYGPYMPLRGGRHRATWRVRPASGASGPVARCDIVVGSEAKVIAQRDVGPDDESVPIEFELPTGTSFYLQFRCLALGGAGFSVVRRVQLEEGVR